MDELIDELLISITPMDELVAYIVFLVVNALVFVAAFRVAYTRKQSKAIYVLLLGLELFCGWVVLFQDVSGSDAAGNAMSQGLRALLLIAIQLMCLLVVLVVFFVRLWLARRHPASSPGSLSS